MRMPTMTRHRCRNRGCRHTACKHRYPPCPSSAKPARWRDALMVIAALMNLVREIL